MRATIFRTLKPWLTLVSILSALLVCWQVSLWYDAPFHMHMDTAQDLAGFCTPDAVFECPDGSIRLQEGVAHLARNKAVINLCCYSSGSRVSAGRRRLECADVHWSCAEKHGYVLCVLDAALTPHGFKITRIYSADPVFRDLFFTDKDTSKSAGVGG